VQRLVDQLVSYYACWDGEFMMTCRSSRMLKVSALSGSPPPPPQI